MANESRAMSQFGKVTRAILCLAVGLLFIYAGGAKLRNLDEFARAVASFQLVPEGMAYPIAIAVPAIECLSGVGVVIPRTRRTGLLSLLFLTVLFGCALAFAAVNGLDLECGCFGAVTGMESDPRLLLARDAGIAAWIGCLYLCELRSSVASSPGSGAGGPDRKRP